MRIRALKLVTLVAVFYILVLAPATLPEATGETDKPNIVLIFIEDHSQHLENNS